MSYFIAKPVARSKNLKFFAKIFLNFYLPNNAAFLWWKKTSIFFRLDSTSVTSEADEAAAVNVAEMMEYS